MGTSKRCIISFRDTDGVEHVAEVLAESVFEAAALGLKKFRRSGWSQEASFQTGVLRIEVLETSLYNVLVSDLEAWLQKTSSSPREMSTRSRILSKLEES